MLFFNEPSSSVQFSSSCHCLLLAHCPLPAQPSWLLERALRRAPSAALMAVQACEEAPKSPVTAMNTTDPIAALKDAVKELRTR